MTLTGFEIGELWTDNEVSEIEVPKGINFVWALVGVPIASMGKLQTMIDELQTIEGAVIEVADDSVKK